MPKLFAAALGLSVAIGCAPAGATLAESERPGTIGQPPDEPGCRLSGAIEAEFDCWLETGTWYTDADVTRGDHVKWKVTTIDPDEEAPFDDEGLDDGGPHDHLPDLLGELNVQFVVEPPWTARTWSDHDLFAGYFFAYTNDGPDWLHEYDHDDDDTTIGLLSITLEDEDARAGTLTALAFPFLDEGPPLEIDMRWGPENSGPISVH